MSNYSKEHAWMMVAHSLSLLSHDDRTKVGAVLVTENHRVVMGTGYNGSYPGGPNERSNVNAASSGQSGLVHAEVNCIVGKGKAIHIMQALHLGHRPGIMYVTHSPCMACAATLIISGAVQKVVYGEPYIDRDGNYDASPVEALEDAGIKTLLLR